MRKSLLVSDGEGVEIAALQKSHWLQRSGMATRERCTNYNNGEGHETSMSDSSVFQYMIVISSLIFKMKRNHVWLHRKGNKSSEKQLSGGHTQLVTTRYELSKTKKNILDNKLLKTCIIKPIYHTFWVRLLSIHVLCPLCSLYVVHQ